MVTARTTNRRKGPRTEEPVRGVPLKRRSTQGQLPDVLHTERNQEYFAQLAAEAEWWDSKCDSPLSVALPPEGQRYENERLTGDPGKTWFEAISEQVNFTNACVLGAGTGAAESHLLASHKDARITVYDISRRSLERLRARLEVEASGRAAFVQCDLNFVELPLQTFDLIVSEASIHHILNLEHLAFQINRSLQPDGWFFIRDAVCESHFGFTEEKKRLFEAFLAATHYGRDKEVVWPDRESWQFSPFESVRSGETLDVFARYLLQVSVRTSGALLMPTMFVRKASGGSRSQPGAKARGLAGRTKRIAGRIRNRFLRPGPGMETHLLSATDPLLFMLDGILSDTGYFRPGLVFGAYRKRGRDVTRFDKAAKQE